MSTTTDTLPLTLTFRSFGSAIEIDWKSEYADGNGIPTPFVMPYTNQELALVVRALDAAQRGGAHFDGAEQEVLAALGLWVHGAVVPKAYRRVGRRLYDALGERGAMLISNYQSIGSRDGRPLAYVLRIPQSLTDVASLPWEALTDPGGPVLSARGHGLDWCERYVLTGQTVLPPPPAQVVPHILVIAPRFCISDAVREQERRSRMEVWEPLVEQGQMSYHDLDPVTPRALNEYLNNARHPPDLIHYVGHGIYEDGEGMLLFDNGQGGKATVSAAQLKARLPNTRVAVVFACQSAMAIGADSLLTGIGPALSTVVGAVVAMQLSIRISAVARFNTTFYTELLTQGRSLQQAMASARLTLYFEDSDELDWYVPALYIRANDMQPIYIPLGPKVKPPSPPSRPPGPEVRVSPIEAHPLRLTLIPGEHDWTLQVENMSNEELTAIRIMLNLQRAKTFDLRPNHPEAIPRLAPGSTNTSLRLTLTPPQASGEQEVGIRASLRVAGRPTLTDTVTMKVHFISV